MSGNCKNCFGRCLLQLRKPQADNGIESLCRHSTLEVGICVCRAFVDPPDLRLLSGGVIGVGVSGSGTLQGRRTPRLSRAQHARRESHCRRRSHPGPAWQPDHEPPDLPLQGRFPARGNYHFLATRQLPAHQLSPGPEGTGVSSTPPKSRSRPSTGQVTVRYTDDDGKEKTDQ